MKHQNIKKIYNFIFYNNTPIIILSLIFSVAILSFAAEKQASNVKHQADNSTTEQPNFIAHTDDQAENDERKDKNNDDQNAESNKVKNSKLGELKIKEKYDNAVEIKKSYRLEKTAFIQDAVDENAIQTEVGNKNLDEFAPMLTIRKWDDEVNLKIKYKHKEEKDKQKFAIEGDKIKWKGDKTEAHFYEVKKGNEITDGIILDSDAYEFEIILLEKPDTNLVEFDIETKGLAFYYQPELTQKEIDKGAKRPENVVGSYAVYHATKKNHIIGQKNYMVGKAFHIYRPKIIDSAGAEVWGNLNIDVKKKLLTVEIPQDFINNAVYPIRHAAGLTFGYTTIGASWEFVPGNDLFGSKFTSPAGAATAISISVYTGSDNPDGYIKGVLVLNSNLNIVTNGIGTAELAPTLSMAWVVSEFSTPPTISQYTDYDICYVTGQSDLMIIWDTGDTNQSLYDGSNSYSSPINPTDASYNDLKVSIYCTYEEAEDPYQPRSGGIGISGGGFMIH